MSEICYTLDINNKPKEYNKLFFGDYGNFKRIDKEPFPIFRRLAENSESNTWFMNEIDYSRDKKSINNLNEVALRMFHLNILYQNNMDSLVPNTFSLLSEVVSESWLSYLYSRISTEEQIHSLTYSNGLNQVFGSKATEMLDYVYTDDILKKRTNKEIETANNFIKILVNQEKTDEEAKKAILDLLIRTLFLEGVKFPHSFFTTWTINKSFNNSIQGFCQSLLLIAWDEMTIHSATGSNVINILMKDKNQEFIHLKKWFEIKTYEIAKETAELEMEWADYLLKDGSIKGYNKDIAYHFIKYWTDIRLKELKLEPIYNEEKSDIIDWYNSYRNLNNKQINLQEADNTNYQKGTLKNDLQRINNGLF